MTRCAVETFPASIYDNSSPIRHRGLLFVAVNAFAPLMALLRLDR